MHREFKMCRVIVSILREQYVHRKFIMHRVMDVLHELHTKIAKTYKTLVVIRHLASPNRSHAIRELMHIAQHVSGHLKLGVHQPVPRNALHELHINVAQRTTRDRLPETEYPAV